MQIPRGLKPTRNDKEMEDNRRVGFSVRAQTFLQAYSRLVKERKAGSSLLKRFGMTAFEGWTAVEWINDFSVGGQSSCRQMKGLQTERKDSLVNGYN